MLDRPSANWSPSPVDGLAPPACSAIPFSVMLEVRFSSEGPAFTGCKLSLSLPQSVTSDVSVTTGTFKTCLNVLYIAELSAARKSRLEITITQSLLRNHILRIGSLFKPHPVYRVAHKIGTFLYALTLPNISRFSKLFKLSESGTNL